jgi:aspartate/glutamate racemase
MDASNLRADFSRTSSRSFRIQDAVALSCTEIPLLISEKDSSLPILDSTRLLARAARERRRKAERIYFAAMKQDQMAVAMM